MLLSVSARTSKNVNIYLLIFPPALPFWNFFPVYLFISSNTLLRILQIISLLELRQISRRANWNSQGEVPDKQEKKNLPTCGPSGRENHTIQAARNLYISHTAMQDTCFSAYKPAWSYCVINFWCFYDGKLSVLPLWASLILFAFSFITFLDEFTHSSWANLSGEQTIVCTILACCQPYLS